MTRYADLKLEAVAIGSLPHKNINSAINVVKKNFTNIPFLPQLININEKEGILNQITEGLSSFSISDYNEVIHKHNPEILEKYAISKNYACAFESFEQLIRNTHPKFAKGQIVGPYSSSYPAEFLSLKALWIIKRIKTASPDTTPIIFIDEPSFEYEAGKNHLLKLVKDIQSNGAICGIHCCKTCNWADLIKTGADIINFDAYTYFDNILYYAKAIKQHLEAGKMLAWGIVPTLDTNVLKTITTNELKKLFEKYVTYLTKTGIDEKLIIENSLITSSCGAGALSEELAQRAMDLVFELSNELKRGYKFDSQTSCNR